MKYLESTHVYAADPENARYMVFLPNETLEETERFIREAEREWQRPDPTRYEFAILRGGEQVGGVTLFVLDENAAELGWILNKRHWGSGYALEAARAVMEWGRSALGFRRFIAQCDGENTASYRLMERLGMRLDHIEKEARPIKREGEIKGDECTYLITREEWQLQTAWAEYHTYSCRFDHFIELPQLTDGAVSLQLEEAKPADPVKKHVPAYHFRIVCQGLPVGYINLRIGYPDSLFYGGQIGYGVAEAFRGRGIAGTACRLLSPVMRAHGMKTALITNEVTNAASRRVCEKIGARFLCQADVPENHEMYQTGSRKVNVFAFDAEN